MPSKLALWGLNLAVVVVLACMGYALKAAGPWFGAGCVVGFAFCYAANGCYRRDIAERRAHFTDQT